MVMLCKPIIGYNFILQKLHYTNLGYLGYLLGLTRFILCHAFHLNKVNLYVYVSCSWDGVDMLSRCITLSEFTHDVSRVRDHTNSKGRMQQ